MANPVRLEHVAIPTTEENHDEVVRFYQDNFGWTTIRAFGDPDSRITFIGDDNGSTLEIYVKSGPPLTLPSHLAFAVPIAEYDALKEKLEATGVSFDIVTENAEGDKLAYFVDPANNRAQIVGRHKPLRG